MGRTLVAVSVVAVLIGCAAAKPNPSVPPFRADDTVVVSALGLRVRMPGPDWKATKNVVVKGDDGVIRVFDLSFLNMTIGATVTGSAFAPTRDGPAVLAQKFKESFAHGRLRTSEVDFSDPEGRSASFLFRSPDPEAIVNGKVVVIRLKDSGARLVFIGVWPLEHDAQGRRDMDAIIGSMIAP